ncbi:UNVERIFIED_CONTAM: hypothetical protein FKN15_048254 [Acipenser sinensis]
MDSCGWVGARGCVEVSSPPPSARVSPTLTAVWGTPAAEMLLVATLAVAMLTAEILAPLDVMQPAVATLAATIPIAVRGTPAVSAVLANPAVVLLAAAMLIAAQGTLTVVVALAIRWWCWRQRWHSGSVAAGSDSADLSALTVAVALCTLVVVALAGVLGLPVVATVALPSVPPPLTMTCPTPQLEASRAMRNEGEGNTGKVGESAFIGWRALRQSHTSHDHLLAKGGLLEDGVCP